MAVAADLMIAWVAIRAGSPTIGIVACGGVAITGAMLVLAEMIGFYMSFEDDVTEHQITE